MDVLCNQIGSRPIGSEGERRAAEYVATQLGEFGWLARAETFPCLAWELQGSCVTLEEMTLKGGATQYSPGGTVEGPLARVRFDPRRIPLVDDFRGRIAWFCESEAGLMARHQACRELRNEGALGVVIVSELQETWSSKIIREPDIAVPTFGLARSQQPILEAGEGKTIRMVVDAKTHPAQSRNVVGSAPGGIEGPFVLVTAHHDAAPYSPGAIDNAVGVAVLLAIAKRFGSSPLAPRFMLATTGGHEYGGSNAGGRGAIALFQAHKTEFLSSLYLQFNLDCTGRSKNEVLACGNCDDAFSDRLRRVAGVPLEMDRDLAGADTLAFYQWGLRVLWPQSRADYVNYCHSPMDTPALIDFDLLADAASRYGDLLEKLLSS